MCKKIISGMLALAMVLGTGAPLAEGGLDLGTSITAAAASNYGDFTYEIFAKGPSENGIVITKWNGKSDSVTIPSEINGIKVSVIGYGAFRDHANLKYVTIPSSITSIGGFAFDGTAWLEDMRKSSFLVRVNKMLIDGKTAKGYPHIQEDVERISDYAFYGNTELTGIWFSTDVTSIGEYAFAKCTSLKDLTMLDKVKTIGDSAFSGCTSLTSVTIPEGVTSIRQAAFVNCTALKSVTIPANVESISSYAFGYTMEPNTESTVGIWSKIPGFKIYCYAGTAGEKYAKDNGFAYELLKKPAHTTHTWDGGKVTKAATCKATGTKTYTCTVCGATKTETIAKTAHKYKTKVVNPTFTAKGYTLHKCSVCGKSYKDKYTAKLSRDVSKSKVTVSKTKAYTGKAIKPSVTVKIGTVKLKKNTDYTVTYKNNKKTGKATITIKGKGKFKGEKTVSFIIVPKKPGTPTAKALGGKKIKVTVKKDKMATGYQIQVSTSKKFTKATTKTATLNKTAKTFTKLKKGKKYYVRTRSYKKVGKTKYYGAYSKLKTVKCK